MANEKINFAVQTSREERDRGMELLAQMDGENNAEKLASMMDMVAGVLARQGLTGDYGRYVDSIKQSVDNIDANVIAIIRAAAEERKHDAVELQEIIETQVKTIQVMQHEREERDNRLKSVEDARVQAEAAATKANNDAKNLAEEKAFYERAARDKESLVELLQEKVSDLQEKLDAAEAMIVELNTVIAKLTAEQAPSPADFDEDNAPPF